MHITEIVLENFKSFGRKTRLPFYEDFTVVTGPNGTGKSNIIDAVLFALGLARTRGIRAEKLTDLIYNPSHEDGERTDGPREALVEVVLDNSDGTLERSQVESAAGTDDVGDVEEIRIRRRVKRTDENYYSYYYLNGRSVNLSDIQDLLAQAGVTPEGYNVVMQGDVTGIISMTPRERREIIDEIAGVAEFDAKKADAFEELEIVADRIDEADLRIGEKRDRLEQLADERRVALRYRRLDREKAEYESYLKASELEEKRVERADLEEEIEDLESTLEKRRRELDERQGTLVRLEEDLEDLNAEIERKGEDEQVELRREIERIRASIEALEDRIERLEADIESREAEKNDALVKIDRKQEAIEEAEAEIREVKLEKAAELAEIEELEGDREQLYEDLEAVDSEYDEVKAELAERREALEAAKDEKNDLQREQDRLLETARRRSAAIEEAEAAIEAAREGLPELEARREDLEHELEKAERNHENIEGVVENLTGERRTLANRIDELEAEIQQKQSEYAELRAAAEQNGDSSFGRAVTTILRSGIDGVHGAIAQLGSVDPQYAEACETAAGGRMANVVVDDDGVGQTCIEHLKSRGAGRATFLPMTKMTRRRLPSPPEDPGVIDFAYNLVEFDPEYEGVFSYVLGDTLVVDDIETARAYMGQYRMVTLEGDLVEKSGAMTGGSRSGSRYSFTEDGKGRLERVAATLEDLTAERDDVRDEQRAVEERLERAREKRADAVDAVRSIEDDIESLDAEREDIEDEIADLEDQLQELEAEREAVDGRMTELAEAIEAATETVESIEAEIDSLQAEIADSKIPEIQEAIDEIEDRIGRRSDRISSMDGKLNDLGLEKSYAEEAIDDLTGTVETAQNRIVELEDEIDGFEAEIGEKNDRLAEKQAAVEELEAELADLKEDREDLRADVTNARTDRDEARERVAEVEAALDGANERLEALAWEIESLEADVGEYDPEDVPDHDVVVEMIGLLEADMAAMQPVNMVAIDEYDDVESEVEDLEESKATLEEEADGIRERIERYETQKKETFMAAYEAINEHFEEIFEDLSDGTGTLHLEDEEDPFDGGLTMKAQPADKPIQRLNAMSGGEKSLTALAFIFALQRHNPAPFYALDEVDAFLDAVNAERVGRMLDELSDRAQFVVVSHRAAMLERSERAIGVTMQSDNVSAVTGIDLSDAEGIPADD